MVKPSDNDIKVDQPVRLVLIQRAGSFSIFFFLLPIPYPHKLSQIFIDSYQIFLIQLFKEVLPIA